MWALRLIMVFVSCLYHPAWASVSLTMDSTNIDAEETFKIILTLEGPHATAIPDLNPLEQNFHIVGTQRSMNYTFVNGNTHTVTQWIVSLTPKRAGKLSIPALHVGNDKTQPQQLTISASKRAPDKGEPIHQGIMLTANTHDTNPYVNQQVIYTVKLYHSQRLLNINYQPPQIEDAVLIPLGSGRHHQEVRSGNVYAVEEQQYAVFPQKKGRLQLVAPVLRVLVEDENGLPKNIILRAKSTELLVKEQSYTVEPKDWMPAKQVSLKETYAPQSLEVEAGETLTRNVILEAVGVPGQLLPKLNFPANEQYSSYLEQAKETSYFKQGNIIGTSVTKVTYLFKQTGTVTLPALQVKWFNTDTGKDAIVQLPAIQVQVLPAPATMNAPKNGNRAVDQASNGNRASDAVSKRIDDHHKQSSISAAMPVTTNRLSVILQKGGALWRSQKVLWGLGVFSILLLGGFALLARFFSKKRYQKKNQDANQREGNKNHQPITQKAVLAQLSEACSLQKPVEAKTSLLSWARLQWPGRVFLTLGDLSGSIEDPLFKQEISRLSEAVYSEEGVSGWSGTGLWELVSQFSKHKVQETASISTWQKTPTLNEL